MFDENEVIEFFNRIINAPDLNDSDLKINITKFYDYLTLTKMCDKNTLKKLSKIMFCIDEIITIKQNIGYIDIGILLLEPEKQKRLYKTPKNNRHYSHYESNSSSSSCGSSSVSVSRC